MQIARYEENILLIFHKDEPLCDVGIYINGVRLKNFTQAQLLERPNIGRFYLFRAHSVKGMSQGASITVIRLGTNQILASAKLTQAFQEASELPAETTQANNYINIYTVTFFDYAGKKLYNGGAERYLADLAELLKKMGWVPRIVQAAHGSWSRMYFDIEVVGINWTEEGMLGLSRNFAQSPPAACHIYSPFTIAAAHAFTPSIGISHGVYWDNGSNTMDNTATKLEVLSGILHCSSVVSVDANTINAIQSVRPDLAAKILYVPNYVDIDSNPITRRTVEKTAQKYITILYPRRLYAPRGFDLSLEAASVILKKYRHVRFLFVGDVIHPEVQQLDGLIRKFPGRVEHMTLPFESMSQAYLQADIAIIPTKHSEGTSLSCLEAMQFGLAIVTTFVGGLSNLVLDEFNGLLVPPTSDALINALDRLIHDEDLRNRLGVNAIQVARCFSKGKWQSTWEKLFNKTFGSVVLKNNKYKKHKDKIAEKLTQPAKLDRLLVISDASDLLPQKTMKQVIESIAGSLAKISGCNIDVVTDCLNNSAGLQHYPRDAEIYQHYTGILSYDMTLSTTEHLLKLSKDLSVTHGASVLKLLQPSKMPTEIGQLLLTMFDLLVARRTLYEIIAANISLDSPIHLGLEVEKRRNKHVKYLISNHKKTHPAHKKQLAQTHLVVSSSQNIAKPFTQIDNSISLADALAIIRSVDSMYIDAEPGTETDQLILLLACILYPWKIQFSPWFAQTTKNPILKTLRLKPSAEKDYFIIHYKDHPLQYSQHHIIKALFNKILQPYWRQIECMPRAEKILDVQIFPASEGLISPNEQTIIAMFQACRIDNGVMEFVSMLTSVASSGLKSLDLKFQVLNDTHISPRLCQVIFYLNDQIITNTEFALRLDHILNIPLEASLFGSAEMMLCVRVKDSRHNFENTFGLSITIDLLEVA